MGDTEVVVTRDMGRPRLDLEELGLLGPAATGAVAALPLGRLADAEQRSVLINALREAGNNRGDAARLLGISRSNFYRRLRQAGLTESNPALEGEAQT
jgi:transcriptional regulator of acetoin/glycerol metabolism